MKTQFRNGLIAGMVILSMNLVAQTSESKVNGTEQKKSPQSHLGLLLNLVTTTIDYGQSSGNIWSNKTSSKGLQLGATFQACITSRLSLVTEFYYLRKGGRLNANSSPTGANTTLRFHTLEVPVMARVHFGKFHINAGPSLTYNLSGKLKSEGSSTSMSFNNSATGFKRFDAGLQVGGGYKFNIKKKQLVIDLRYSRGLTNLSQSQEVYSRYLNLSLQIVNPWKTNPLAAKNKATAIN
jgi:hypothetical protein